MWGWENMLLTRLLNWRMKMPRGYVLLSSIHVAAAAGGNRHLCEKVEQQRKERGMKRQLDYTRIEVNYQMWYH